MKPIELIPTTQAHIAELADKNVPFRVKAVTATVDGRVVGIGGIGFPKDGMPTAFAFITDELRARKVTLHKIGLRCVSEWRAAGIRQVMALADSNVNAAERWLLRYGFEKQIIDGRSIFTLRLN